MSMNLIAVRGAIEQAKALAAEFHTGIARAYEDGNPEPIFVSPCRVKKPRPTAFGAGNQTEWSTKRTLTIKVPLDANGGELIRKGLIIQVETPDGDPTINQINFVVQSSLVSQFAAEREIVADTEVNRTPRIAE